MGKERLDQAGMPHSLTLPLFLIGVLGHRFSKRAITREYEIFYTWKCGLSKIKSNGVDRGKDLMGKSVTGKWGRYNSKLLPFFNYKIEFFLHIFRTSNRAKRHCEFCSWISWWDEEWGGTVSLLSGVSGLSPLKVFSHINIGSRPKMTLK